MINLLPMEEKKKLRDGYRMLVLAVSLPMLSSVLVVALLTLFPSFVLTLSNYEKILNDSKSSEAVTKQAQEQEMKDTVKSVNLKLAILRSASSEIKASAFFEQILRNRSEGVFITALSYEKSPGGTLLSKRNTTPSGPVIALSGYAEKRDDLLSFVSNLKKIKGFSSVDLPISSLVSESDLPYSLNIAVSK